MFASLLDTITPDTMEPKAEKRFFEKILQDCCVAMTFSIYIQCDKNHYSTLNH
jgi:hypothetical protein